MEIAVDIQVVIVIYEHEKQCSRKIGVYWLPEVWVWKYEKEASFKGTFYYYKFSIGYELLFVYYRQLIIIIKQSIF